MRPTFPLLIGVVLLAADNLPAQQNQRRQNQNRPGGNSIPGQVARWLSGDANEDGKLAKSETEGRLKQNFERVDTDKDGFLQRRELQALATRLARNANRARPNNRTRPNQAEVSDEALRKMAPEGVTVLANIAYREPSDDVPGSQRWRLDLAMPKDRGEQPRPAVVFVHGGGWRSGDKRRSSFLTPALNYAANGYVTVTVNYRLLSHGPLSNCVEDVKCAVRWLRAHADDYNVDPERIGAYGNSAGAHLVSMLGLCPKSAGLEGDGPWQDESSNVQAVCASATPTSFLSPMNSRVRTSQNNGAQNGVMQMSDEMKAKVSPITYVSAEAPPFLLVHEASDRTVNVSQSDQLVEALKKAGATDVTYMRYEDGTGHGTFNANQKETKPAMRKFFDRVLNQQ